MADTLTTTRATKPGAYIGRIFRPTPTGLSGFARLPCLVGKGNRLQTVFNAQIRRSYRNAVPIVFTGTSPHVATLVYAAENDQTITRVYDTDGNTVPASAWIFTESSPGVSGYNQVVMLPEVFNANKNYRIDYQSTSRLIKDELPFSEIREVRFVGDTENQELYVENVNFNIPVTLSEPAADTGNANVATTGFTTPAAATGNTGTATLTITAGSFTGDYSRTYTAEVTSVGGTVEVDVRVTLPGGGADIEAPSPYHADLAVPAGLTASFATPGGISSDTITDPETGDVITLQLDDSGADVIVTDSFEFVGLGISLVEVDTALANTNQFPDYTTVTKTVTNADVVVSLRDDSTFTGLTNRKYILQCTAAAGVTPSRTASFVWTGYGESPVTGSAVGSPLNIAEAIGSNLDVSLEMGVKVDFDFGAVQFTAGDLFEFEAKAPRKYVNAKDSRSYSLTVNSAVAGSVEFQYITDTPEGKFGTATATGPGGSLRLPGGIDLYVRNIGSLLSENRYVAADFWTFSTVNEEVIDWQLTSRVSETINTTEILTDTLGSVTGVVGAAYVILSNIPTDVLFVQDTATDALLTATALTTRPILWFLPANKPVNTIEISYEYVGPEPAPGSFYYITANVVRAPELYNVPILSLSFEEADRLLGPVTVSNDLYIGAQLALEDNGAPGIYSCQAFDADGDGVISSVDIDAAILATEENATLTDIVVLNGNSSLSTALSSNQRMNDPFERKERALWVGLPVGTAIGSINASGTVVYTAKRTLQVYGANHARGTRVLVANSRATKTITLTDGTQTTVTLDGSFIQAAIAAVNASFADPGTPLLRQTVAGFASMQTFSEPEELQLQGASVLYLSNQGSVEAPVFRIEESVTVDTSSPDNNEIGVAINQKQFVTREVRSSMEDSLLAVLPPTEQAGVSIVRTFLVTKLADLASRGIIGAYTDNAGNARAINASTDVEVFRSKSDHTLYNFKYYWVGRYPIKRLFGLYSVDKKFFTG